MLGPYFTLIGSNQPFAVTALAYRRYPGMPVNLGAAVARAFRHRLRRLARIDVAIERLVNGADQVADLGQRVYLFKLGGGQDIEVETGELADALHLAKFVQAIRVAGDAQRAAGVKADRLPGFLGQYRLVQLHAMRAQVHDGDVMRVVGTEPGGVPGRARGELVFFDQHDVVPAQLGQVIDQRCAHGAAADDGYPDMSLHLLFAR